MMLWFHLRVVFINSLEIAPERSLELPRLMIQKGYILIDGEVSSTIPLFVGPCSERARCSYVV
jgi:hypothetical protein